MLLLTQVLNWSAAEAAEGLDMTVASVNSALQRARATMQARDPSVMPRGSWRWLTTFGIGCQGSVLVPVQANGGTPAFAQYRDGGYTPWAILMLDLDGAQITGMTAYLDVGTFFSRFGLRPRMVT